jgi:electron transfer flavoprotein beta subunit
VPEQIAAVLGLPSVTFAKSVEIDGGTVKVDRQTEAGYDEVDVAAARRGLGDRRCGRAPLPVLQGHHGRQVEARRSAVTVADLGIEAANAGWAGAGQEIIEVATAAQPVRPARSSRTTAKPSRRSSTSSSNLKVI